MDSFIKYIDSLGRLDETDLYMDIDETMASREETKRETSDELKSYTSHAKHRGTYSHRKRDLVSGIKRS